MTEHQIELSVEAKICPGASMIGPTLTATAVVMAVYAGWAAGVAILVIIANAIGWDQSISGQATAIFAPICALLYCSARW